MLFLNQYPEKTFSNFYQLQQFLLSMSGKRRGWRSSNPGVTPSGVLLTGRGSVSISGRVTVSTQAGSRRCSGPKGLPSGTKSICPLGSAFGSFRRTRKWSRFSWNAWKLSNSCSSVLSTGSRFPATSTFKGLPSKT